MIIRSDSSELGCLGVCSGDADQEPASAIEVNQWKWAFTELPKSGEEGYHVMPFSGYGCSMSPRRPSSLSCLYDPRGLLDNLADRP